MSIIKEIETLEKENNIKFTNLEIMQAYFMKWDY